MAPTSSPVDGSTTQSDVAMDMTDVTVESFEGTRSWWRTSAPPENHEVEQRSPLQDVRLVLRGHSLFGDASQLELQELATEDAVQAVGGSTSAVLHAAPTVRLILRGHVPFRDARCQDSEAAVADASCTEAGGGEEGTATLMALKEASRNEVISTGLSRKAKRSRWQPSSEVTHILEEEYNQNCQPSTRGGLLRRCAQVYGGYNFGCETDGSETPTS
eukprot:6028321-Prymnesium_polylepis.2